jgi:cytochrome c oxidase assembly factor CtaG
MTTGRLLASAWDWEPSVVLGCAALVAGYGLLARPLTARALAFAAGVLTLLFSLVSPLDVLGDRYLFSAHMAQHLLLTLVVPPLLLVGLPLRLVSRLVRLGPVGRVEAALFPARGEGRRATDEMRGSSAKTGRTPPPDRSSPFALRPSLLAGLLPATVALWVWHLPVLYNAALDHAGLHVVQHLVFLATATLFWWPVVAPFLGRPGLAPLAAVGYLFAALAAGSVLGIILAFAPPGLYPAYVRPVDTLGALPLLRSGWGLTPEADQQLGGFLMWIPGGIVYSLAMVAALARWFGEPEDEPEGDAARPAPAAGVS